MCAGVRSARVRLDDLLKDLSKKTEERYISLLSNLLLKYFYERRNNWEKRLSYVFISVLKVNLVLWEEGKLMFMTFLKVLNAGM